MTALDAHAVTGQALQVKYKIDLMSGVCKAIIYLGGEPFMERDGQMGIDCALTSSNQKQSEIANGIRLVNSAAQFIGGAASGSVTGMMQGAEGVLQNNIYNHFQSTASNAPISAASYMDVFVIFDRPLPTVSNIYPNAYAKTVGLPCMKTIKLGSLKGYLKCSGDIKLDSSIVCSNEERKMIIDALQNGVDMEA